jgi:hypothetical protein
LIVSGVDFNTLFSLEKMSRKKGGRFYFVIIGRHKNSL